MVNRKKNSRSSNAVGAMGGRVVGSGDYWSDIKTGAAKIGSAVKQAVPKGSFAKAGSAIGGAFGNAGLGASAGNLFSKLVGFGDYDVQHNSLVKMDMGASVPAFGNVSQGVTVSHREYIGDLVAPGITTFTNFTYSLNPGLPGTFPFLSSIAGNFDQYQFHGAVVQFKSTASDYATGTALGSVVIASEYDVVDQAYASKVAMENSQYCTSAKPSVDISHPIECDSSVNVLPRLYIRGGGVPSGADPRMYDHCRVNVAVVGNGAAAGTVLGELWVTYHVTLYKPQISVGSLFDHVILTAAGIGASHYLGIDTTTAPTTRSTLSGTVNTVNDRYYFPPNIFSGNYMIKYATQGTSTTLTQPATITLGGSMVALLLVSTDLASSIVQEDAIASRYMTATKFITIVGRDAYFSIAGTQLSASTYGDLYVIKLPDLVN